MFHDDGAASLELALTTLAAARSRPSLAAAIRGSTRRPKRRGWVAEFLRYPRWSRVRQELELDVVGEEWDDPLEDFGTDCPLPDHWMLLVEREAIKQIAKRQSLSLLLLGSERPKDATETAMQLAIEELGAETALWIGDGERGLAASSFAPRTNVRSQSERRRSFERHCLPWYFRQSREFELGEGLIAVVYAGVPIDGLEDWHAALKKARDKFRLRDSSTSISLEAEIDARYWSAIAEFGAGAGHTINNPLGAIAGLAERLLEDERVSDRRDRLYKIRTQVDRIHRMIRDLHLLGRSEKRLEAAASLKDCIAQGVAKAVGRFADKPTPRFKVSETPNDLSVAVPTADLARVVEELAANAIEAAGPNGFVEVRVHPSLKSAELHVVDSGPGFSATERAHAFAPFFAGRAAGRGLGMGLPVCRRIVERIGGRIDIARDRPTRVSALLPLAEAERIRRAA